MKFRDTQQFLSTMRERDCKEKIRQHREDFMDVLREQGLSKVSSSLTNITKECQNLAKKYKAQDETTMKHRLINTYVHHY